MFSRTPSCSSPSTSLPTCASVCSTKPANTSISRRWKGRSASGMLSHDAIVSARGVSFASAGNPAEFLLPLEDPLAVLVPAVVELPFVLVSPLREDVVRAMDSTGCPIHQKWLIGREGLMPLDPGDPLVDHIFGQVVFLAMRRLDRVEIFVQPGLPLRRFAGEEAIEVVEPVAGGPAVKRAHRGGLVRGGVVPLPKRRGLVAVVVEHFGQGGGRLRNDAGVSVEVGRPLGNGPVTDPVMVPAGQEGGSGGGADRGRVKRVVADSRITQPGERRCVDLSAEGVRDAEAHVVDQHDEDVRCTRLESLGFLSPPHRGFLQRRAGHAGRRRRRERENGTIRCDRRGALLPRVFPRAQRSHDADQGKDRQRSSERRVVHWQSSHRGSRSSAISPSAARLLVRQAAVVDVEVGVEDRLALFAQGRSAGL